MLRFIFTLLILHPAIINAEEIKMLCKGDRNSNFIYGKDVNVTNFESVLLKIKNDSMEYIGFNSGRIYFFSNREYSAPKRPPHEDINIKEQYQYTPNKITASLAITDTGDTDESSISLFSLDINLLTGKLIETESISNKKTNMKTMSNNFQALCKREDSSY